MPVKRGYCDVFILVIFHVLICLALILIVLLQKGKGASMGAAFGGSSQTVFGSRGATSFLSKATTAVAVIFMLTSLGLSIYFGTGRPTSIMEGVGQRPPAEEGQFPAQDGGTAPAPEQAAPPQGGEPPAQQ
jgi:preprotein translocase subunit SecG